MPKNIELEYRARVPRQSFASVQKRLEYLAQKTETTNRFSAMYFGKQGKQELDIRVRITNGQAEVVMKKGGLHAHDRTELSQSINTDEFLGFVNLFLLLDYKCEIAERKTINYYLAGGVVASLVEAGPMAYLEIEKMSTSNTVQKNSVLLLVILENLGLSGNLIKTAKVFYRFCDELSAKVDWVYKGTKPQQKKLAGLLKKYKK